MLPSLRRHTGGSAPECLALLRDHSSEERQATQNLEGEIKCLLGLGQGPFMVSHLQNLS